jgi:hypothetical protein
MRRLLRAAIAAVSIGSIPPAMADPNPNTVFTQLPEVIAQAPAQTVLSIDTAQTDIHSGRGTWIFPPIGKYLDQRVRG